MMCYFSNIKIMLKELIATYHAQLLQDYVVLRYVKGNIQVAVTSTS